MSHFSAKTLSFYGVAISSVLLLFKVVSAYGETNLIAAPDIGGLYKIVDTQNLPDCLKGQNLNLTIEQSGVYLFGNLAEQPIQSDAKSPEKSSQKKSTFSLIGNFKDSEITLSGQGGLPNCDPRLQFLTIQGRREQDKLVGTLTPITGAAGSFTAQYKADTQKVSSEGH